MATGKTNDDPATGWNIDEFACHPNDQFGLFCPEGVDPTSRVDLEEFLNSRQLSPGHDRLFRQILNEEAVKEGEGFDSKTFTKKEKVALNRSCKKTRTSLEISRTCSSPSNASFECQISPILGDKASNGVNNNYSLSDCSWGDSLSSERPEINTTFETISARRPDDTFIIGEVSIPRTTNRQSLEMDQAEDTERTVYFDAEDCILEDGTAVLTNNSLSETDIPQSVEKPDRRPAPDRGPCVRILGTTSSETSARLKTSRSVKSNLKKTLSERSLVAPKFSCFIARPAGGSHSSHTDLPSCSSRSSDDLASSDVHREATSQLVQEKTARTQESKLPRSSRIPKIFNSDRLNDKYKFQQK